MKKIKKICQSDGEEQVLEKVLRFLRSHLVTTITRLFEFGIEFQDFGREDFLSMTSVDRSEASRLSPTELARYDRHIILNEVGREGQEKLKASRVLLIGSGGLGSPLALYLVAAGVGVVGIVDFDRVDESNLQRQILHGTEQVGMLKVDSAKKRLNDLNPFVEVVTHEVRLSSQNALSILKDYDLVIDGTDNFATRYLVNDACVILGKPNVYGSIFRFEGQVSLFDPGDSGPCYRCLYPDPPPPSMVPSCAEGGVLGVLPGVIGTLQATEAVKFLLGTGQSLNGRLLTFDALKMKFREMKFRRNPNCPVCGDEPVIRSLIDYQQFCGVNQDCASSEGLSPQDFLKTWKQGGRPILLDVREQREWAISNLEEFGAKLCPLSELSSLLVSIDKNEDIVVYCKSGARSQNARKLLKESGFEKVQNLAGGILRWSDEIDSSKIKY